MQLSAAKRTPLAVDPRHLGSRKIEYLDIARGQLHSFRFDQVEDASSSRSDAAPAATMQKSRSGVVGPFSAPVDFSQDACADEAISAREADARMSCATPAAAA